MTQDVASEAIREPGADFNRDVSELYRLRMQIFAMSAENERLRNTVSYRLGSAILNARRWRGLLGLPSALMDLIMDSRRRRGHRIQGDGGGAPAINTLLRQILLESDSTSVEQIVSVVEAEKATAHYRGEVLTELAKIIRPADGQKAIDLMRHAARLDTSAARSAIFAGMLLDDGAIDEPHRIYQRLKTQRRGLNLPAQQKAAMVAGAVRVQERGLTIGPKNSSPKFQPINPRSVLYVAASSSPYHTTGYTSRTQALVKAIGSHGWTVHVVTRPGYPQDRNDIHRMPAGVTQTVNGIDYSLLPGPRSNGVPFDKYCAEASQSIYRQLEKVRPGVVHAASNYLNATPALIAARQAGLPFVYEVRGLWELTQAAKNPRFEASERFDWQKQRETAVAQQADLVITISQGLRRELIERGVSADRIVIVPNCVDVDSFKPRPRDQELAKEILLGDSKVLGFVGSMTSYEGLIDLVTALSRLRKNGADVCGLLVGDGPAWQEVREVARSLGMQHHIIMPGRVPHADVARWYSLMDVAVYPRLPSRVTELVPPLKPLEAMAMGLPVVASDVSAIRESIVDGRNGFLFARGEVDSLTSTLERVLQDTRAVRGVAKQGRADVKDLFTWDAAAKSVVQAYAERLSG